MSQALWNTLNANQQNIVLTNMKTYGGSFVSRLAEAWERADSVNSTILGLAFDVYVREYFNIPYRTVSPAQPSRLVRLTVEQEQVIQAMVDRCVDDPINVAIIVELLK